MASWADLERDAPELAAFAARLLTAAPAYLATVRADGRPRVHPVTPIIGDGRLFVFMEPTSPKGHDLQRGSGFALHNGVPDGHGSGGEVRVSGTGQFTDDPSDRVAAVAASSYAPADRYVLFELAVDEVRANTYDDVPAPSPARWQSPTT